MTATNAFWGTFMVQSLADYNDQSTYMLHKSSALVYVKGVRSLNLDPESPQMANVVLDFNFDKDTTTLAALLVKVDEDLDSDYYIKIISITLSNKETRVGFVKEYKLKAANKIWDNDYTQHEFNFSFMKDNSGSELGPTVTFSLCFNKPCNVDVLTKINSSIAPLQMTSNFQSVINLNDVINIMGSKTAEDYSAIYFFGYYAVNNDQNQRKPIMFKVGLQQLAPYFDVQYEYLGQKFNEAGTKDTEFYVDMSFLVTTDGTKTEVLLRSVQPTYYASESGVTLDVVDTVDPDSLISFDINYADVSNLVGKAIKCGQQNCRLMIKDIATDLIGGQQLIFISVNLNNLNAPMLDKKIIFSIRNVFKYRADTIPVVFNNKSDQDAIFAIPTAKYMFNGFEGRQTIDFGSDGKVSIIGSTENANCLESLFDPIADRTFNPISITTGGWVSPEYADISASLQSLSAAILVPLRVDTWSEIKKSATLKPSHAETPWSSCFLEYVSGDNKFDPGNDQTYRLDFRYTESTSDNKLKIGPMQFVSRDVTKNCLEDELVWVDDSSYEYVSPDETVPNEQIQIDNYDQFTCLISFEKEYCDATELYLAMQKTQTFVKEGDQVYVQYNLPVDSKNYDGIEIEYQAYVNAINADVQLNTGKFKLKWIYVGESSEIDAIVEENKAYTQLDAPVLTNSLFGESIEVELGQLERIALGQPTSTLGSQDKITLSLFVDQKLIKLNSCEKCPILLESTDILIEATDYAFEVYNPYAVKTETLEESTYQRIKQQTLKFQVLLNCSSSVTLLETSYSFSIKMKRQIVEDLEPEVITEANNSTSDQQGDVTPGTGTTDISETVTEANSITSNSTIANDETNAIANLDGSDGTTLDLDEIVKEIDQADSTNTTEIKAAVKLYNNLTIKQVSEEIAQVLNISDIKQTVESTQMVFQTTSETDIKEAQSFSIFDFLNSKGIVSEILNKPDAKSLPNVIVQNQLKGDFAIPVPTPMFRDGSLSFKLSGIIESLDFEKTLAKFMSESDKRRLLKESEQLIGYGDFKDDSAKKKANLQALTQLLKLTQSIKTELIPGDDFGLDKKGYSWQITEYEEQEIVLKFDFEDPFYISVEKVDVMKITFNNTSVILQPMDLNLKNLPDLYTQVVDVPPQGANVMSKTQLGDAQTTGQTLVVTNFILSVVFKQALAMLFSSIISIQILAHFALADIFLPANAKQSFDIMVSAVSFDFFQPTEYFDLGFSDMPPFSPQFAELSYETINFVDCMGSILVLFTLLVLYLIVVGCLAILKVQCCRKLQNRFRWEKVEMSSIELINGTFFEVLVSVSVSMQMLQYQEYLNEADRLSIALQFVFVVVLVLYICAVVYFSVFKVGKIAKFEEAKRITSIQQEQIELTVKTLFIKNKKFNKKYSEEELLKQAKEKKLKKMKFLRNVTNMENKGLKSVKNFKPLTENLRPQSKLALLSNLFINIRRLTQLYMAMFVRDGVWMQIVSFTVMNLFSVIYLLHTMPYKKPFDNYVNIMNELASLIVAYFIMVINGQSRDPDAGVMMGEFIVYTLQASWSMNLLLIAIVVAKDIQFKARKWFYGKGRWKYNCLQTQSFIEQIQETRRARKKVETKTAQTQTFMVQEASKSESESSEEEDNSVIQLLPSSRQQIQEVHHHHHQPVKILINPKLDRSSLNRPSKESMKLLISSPRVRSEHQKDIGDIDPHRMKDGVSNQNYAYKKELASIKIYRQWTNAFSSPFSKSTPQQRANAAYVKQPFQKQTSVKQASVEQTFVKHKYRTSEIDVVESFQLEDEDVVQDFSDSNEIEIKIESPRIKMLSPEMIVSSLQMIDTSVGADRQRQHRHAKTSNNASSTQQNQDMMIFSDAAAAVRSSSIK